ncbi:MAG: glycosyltransferase family 4 protein [Kiritimatiellae bacterium]|nr:glycosyltransferase family 4 protein [Kiritimatiellia bacterium]
MRILLVEFRDPLHPQAGGAETLLLEVAARLVAAGHGVDYLCCRPAGAAPQCELRGVRVIRRGPQPLFNYVAPAAALRLRREHHHDVIVEGLDKVPFFLPLLRPGCAVVAHVPHLFGETIFREAPWPLAAYVWAMERPIPWVYRRCRFSALSETTRDDLIRRGVRPDRIRVIPPGIDHARYRPDASVPRAAVPTLLYVGRLKRYKSIETALAALAQLRRDMPEARLEIVGAGDHEPALRRTAAELGLGDAVDFAGRVSEEEKIRRMRRACALVYPSPKEGWGLSVIEANACGTPAIASDSPGLRDAVLDGVSGMLVRHGDPRALATAARRLLTDPALAARLREGALRWAARFSWERAAADMADLLRAAIADHAARRAGGTAREPA